MSRTAAGRAIFDTALRHARELAGILTEGDVGTTTVRLGAVSVSPTQRLAANVDELIVGKIKSIGTVEGTLVTITRRDGLRFYVEDRIRGHRVECHFEDDLKSTVMGAFDKRVMVRGVVWKRKDGKPQRIDVRTFEVLENDDQLPRARAVRGILREFRYDDEQD